MERLSGLAAWLLVAFIPVVLTGCRVKVDEDPHGQVGLVTSMEKEGSDGPPATGATVTAALWTTMAPAPLMSSSSLAPQLPPAPAMNLVPVRTMATPTVAPARVAPPPTLRATTTTTTLLTTLAPTTTITYTTTTETVTTVTETGTPTTTTTRTGTKSSTTDTVSGTKTTTETTTSTSVAKALEGGPFVCDTGVNFKDFALPVRKGLCMDDTTFKDCPSKVPAVWPNTDGTQVTSLRLFRPWHPSWGGEYSRQQAWGKLLKWVKRNKAKVLLGTPVSCDIKSDTDMWFWNIELLKVLGKEHIMGVAIGDEMDIFRDARSPDEVSCNDELWNGKYWSTLQARVNDLDMNGLGSTKVTAVWALSVLGATQTAFKEDSAARVNTLLTHAYKKWGQRWAWTFNVYTIWDRSLWPTSESDCADRSAAAVSIESIKGVVRELRSRIKMITGNDDDTLWVGETGWSAPAPKTVRDTLSFCPAFWSLRTFQHAYRNFLAWDLEVGSGMRGPDHAFYFTTRDSTHATGAPESFGLVQSCSNSSCKIQADSDAVHKPVVFQ